MRSFGLRLIHLTLVLVLVSLGTLLLTELVPGDAAATLLGPEASEEQYQAVRRSLGLDKALPERWASWVGDAVRGDLGRSMRTREPVWDSIRERIPVTAQLAFMSLGLSLSIAVPVGVLAARKPEGVFDRISGSLASMGIASPTFLSAILLIFVLSVHLKWFPVAGWVPFGEDPWQNLRHIALPVVAISLSEMSSFSRLLRGDMVDTLDQDYILAARSVGLPQRTVLFRHALRPSSFSLVTVSGISLGRTIGGTVIVEQIFALPGLGQLAINAIAFNDLIVLQGVVLFVATVYVVVNILLALLYLWLDPRIRKAGARG